MDTSSFTYVSFNDFQKTSDFSMESGDAVKEKHLLMAGVETVTVIYQRVWQDFLLEQIKTKDEIARSWEDFKGEIKNWILNMLILISL